MDDEHPKWLPADWKVCVRVRSSGKKDKYYFNPSNDLKFNSKTEVIRHLKKAEKDLQLMKLTKVDIKKSVAEKLPSEGVNETRITRKGGKIRRDLVDITKSVAERLPSEGVKETRITRKGGKTRRDLWYTDPADGRRSRSLQEVKHCLEAKKTGKTECNLDDSDHPSEELGDHCKSPTAVAERQKLIDEKGDETSSGNESLKSGAAVESINPPEADASGQTEKGDNSMVEDEQQEKAAVRKKRKKHSKWMNSLPRRSSKRLARVEAVPPLVVKSRSGDRLTDEAGINTNQTLEKSKQPVKRKKQVFTSENLDELKKVSTSLPLGDLECAGIDLNEEEKKENKTDLSLNDLFMDPCIEFAIKTLTGAIPLQDVNDGLVASPAQASASASSSVPPFSDFWSDPCFEFAVRTLTSEIPMEDDGSHFQMSFQQPLSSGCNTNAK